MKAGWRFRHVQSTIGSVTDAAKKLLEEVLALPVEDQRWLSDKLIERVRPEHEDVELHPAWIPEIKRRIEDVRSGRVESTPADEALARVRARLQKG